LVTTFSKLVGFLTNTYNAVKRIIDFIKNNPLTNLFDDGSKGLRAGGPIEPPIKPDDKPFLEPITPPIIPSAPVVVTSKFGGTRDISGLSTMQQAAVLRSIELQAETQRLRDQRAAAAEARQNNITVNMGIVGDPERAARDIINLLNQSQARGTVGAGLLIP